jgi:transposase
MNVTTMGIDLAKSVFQVHGVDARGKVVLRRQLRREQVATFFVNLPCSRASTSAGSNSKAMAPTSSKAGPGWKRSCGTRIARRLMQASEPQAC